jgi:SAM-dependent methyltransferase
LHAPSVRKLLGAMVALGLAQADGGGHRLTEAAAELAGDHPRTLARIVEKEWYFYTAWSGLDDAVRDGHARIAPWRERLAADPLQSERFLEALDDLAARFGGELPALAGLGRGGTLLDVGGGAGSHAAYLAASVPGLEPTVLDLPAVEPVTRARHPELPFVAGDLELPRFGRPDGETWDAVLLANILHDHPPGTCARIVAEAASLLGPGGTLLVYEWVLDDCRDSPADVALFALMMLVENDGGASYTGGEISGWLTDAGLCEVEIRRGAGPIAVVSGTAPGASQ